LLITALAWSPGTHVLADATIDVRVVDAASRPADGEVTFVGPKKLSCRTVAARCSLKAPAGSYSVTIKPRRDKAPKARKISVPDKGSLKVVITLREGDEAAAKDKSAVTKPENEHDKVRKNPPGRDLAAGKTQRMTGRVVDARSRPADAVIVLHDKNGKVVGHVKSVSARFNLRDIDVGAYSAKVYSRRGGPPTKQKVEVTKKAGQLVIKVK
jgi:hypothetical protein